MEGWNQAGLVEPKGCANETHIVINQWIGQRRPFGRPLKTCGEWFAKAHSPAFRQEMAG
jgi:hypothetical protein